MSLLANAVSNLVQGQPFVLDDEELSHYPKNLSMSGTPPSKEAIISEMEKLLALQEQKQKIANIRTKINDTAGDTQSLLGTTADGMQLLFYAFSQLNLALSTADSLEEVRAAAPFNELATSFLSKLDAGEVKLPFQAKGIENVVADIESRATAVYDTLNNTQEDKS